jgi:hypothetical protein
MPQSIIRPFLSRFTLLAVGLLAVGLLASAISLSAARRVAIENPDFTRGDSIPEGAVHDWNLGATGARGWIYFEQLTTLKARQIRITQVDLGSPADGKLKVGDVLLGVGGQPFSYDPRTELGRAITSAESESGGGKLRLTRWRDGHTDEITIDLLVLGTYSPTAPYNCEKSRKILEKGCQALAERMSQPSYRGNPITRSLNALALLASDNPDYHPIVKREAEWASDYSVESMATWWYGYVSIMLAEYVMATGDDSVLPGLRRIAMEAARGQSIVGSWGHKFAGPDGRLVGYGMMNSPGAVLTLGLVLAREAGVDDPEVAVAIERSAKLLRFYINKGAVPYGDHAPWMQTHEDNGKCGMAAVLFDQLNEKEGAEFFSRMSVASHGNERDTGHTGNFFNLTWAMPAVARSGPAASGAWMQEFGSWYYDLARIWDWQFSHQGPPQARNDSYHNWDASGLYLIAYAMPLKAIRLTGSQPSIVPQLDPETAESLMRDGRGWDRLNRDKAYDSLGMEQLLGRLGSWSPIVRERAAMALTRRDEDLVPTLVKMLSADSIDTRLGACRALAQQKGKAADAVPALRQLLREDHLWLRVQAAEALAATGDAGRVALPELLKRLTVGATKEDPRAMEQRYLCFIVFGKMLKKSADDVDPKLLWEAVTAALQNQDGRARNDVSKIYSQLTYEEIRPLLPAIHASIVNPAPSGIMFADGIRLEGLKLFAKHRIAEGIPLCFSFLDLERWNKRSRIAQCLDALEMYGAAAKPVIPKLEQLKIDLTNHREARGLQSLIERTEELIAKIGSATEKVELRHLN